MKRIQRKRTAGYKLPENAKYVGRPGLFGNPFMDSPDGVHVYMHVPAARTVLSTWVVYDEIRNVGNAAQIYADMLYDSDSHDVPQEIKIRFRKMRRSIDQLDGHDLACWCPLHAECHADKLIQYFKDQSR